jgi:pimeloyl-ACP methyl ester carboxylesterase
MCPACLTTTALIVAGATSTGGLTAFAVATLRSLTRALRTYGWSSVTTEIIANGGHYLPDERPKAVAELIERYAGR